MPSNTVNGSNDPNQSGQNEVSGATANQAANATGAQANAVTNAAGEAMPDAADHATGGAPGNAAPSVPTTSRGRGTANHGGIGQPDAAQRGPEHRQLVARVGDIPNKLPQTRVELPHHRTTHSTRFLNPDGSFTEVIYPAQRFYQDPADGEWKAIDNTLQPSQQNPNMYENAANNHTAQFATQVSRKDSLVTLEQGGNSVALTPKNALPALGMASGNAIMYQGIYPNVNARYTVQGPMVKEEIILLAPTINTFVFTLTSNNLQPAMQADGSIAMQNGQGQSLFTIAKPFMVDANGRRSDNVTMTLRQTGGQQELEVVADNAFLQDPATAYPVTIDPSLQTNNVFGNTAISSTNPATNYYQDWSMDVGTKSGKGVTRALLGFTLPSLPSDSVIQTASISLYNYTSGTAANQIDLYRITSDWDWQTVTWNTQPTVSGPESSVTSNAVNAYWSWDITKLAKDWYNGVQKNFGVELRATNETLPYREFASYAMGDNQPMLTITYNVDPAGQESFWYYTNDSVQPMNGNLMLRSQDVNLKGRGFATDLTRTYNSRRNTALGAFGYGWRHSYEMQLVDAGKGPVTLIDADGTRHILGETFTAGQYATPAGQFFTLVKNGDGTYTMTLTDGSQSNFTKTGKLASHADPNGNTMTFGYDASDRLITITDPSGRITTLTYNANGRVASIVDPANRTTTFSYDTANNLIQATDPAGHVSAFTYDASHHVTSATDPRGIKRTITYDTSGRLSTLSQPLTINGTVQTATTTYTYDTTNSVTTLVDGEGRRTDYTWNAIGSVVQLANNPTDPATRAITTYTYDDQYNATSTVDPNTNAAGGTSAYVYTYDANGNITGVQRPDQTQALNTYDASNDLIKAQDFNQNINTMSYDENSNQTENTDPNISTQAQRYDQFGNLLYKSRMMATASNLVQNSSFERAAAAATWPEHWGVSTQAGTTASFAWATTGRFGSRSVSITNPTGWAVIFSDPVPYQAGTSYIASSYIKTVNATGRGYVKVDFLDSVGNWLGQTVSFGIKGTQDWTRISVVVDSVPANTTQMQLSVSMDPGTGTSYFDGVQLEQGTSLSAYNLVENGSFERVTGTNKLPDYWTGSSTLGTNDGVDATTAYVGTRSFKITGEANKNKYVTQRVFLSGDSTTRLTLSGWSKQTGINPSGGLYALQVAVNYTDGTTDWGFANDFDRTVTGWQHGVAEVNPTKPFTSIDVYYYYYNQTGTAWFDAMRLEIGSSITFISYDANSNYVTSTKDPLGHVTSYTNDLAGNVTSLTDARNNKTTFTFDAVNQLTQVTDAKNGVTRYGYDKDGNLTTVTDASNNMTTYAYTEFNDVASVTVPTGQITRYAYDRSGNLTGITNPNGTTISYTFNAQNRMDSVSFNGTKQWSFGYDRNGNLTTITDASGGTVTNTYDSNNRLTKRAGWNNSQSFAYDDNGNLISVTGLAGSTSIQSTMTYSPLNQLIKMQRGGLDQVRFIYDERGNLITVTRRNSTFTGYEYDANERVTLLKNYAVGGTLMNQYTVEYDAVGNITSLGSNSGTQSFQYDANNQLTLETLTDGSTITYAYDAVGNRTAKTVTKNGTTTSTTYTYDASNHLLTINGQTITYDANGNLTSNGTRTFVYDAANRLTQIQDAAGASVAAFAYDWEGKRTTLTTGSSSVIFHYDADGNVIYETDSNNNVIADYQWDDQGRPVTMTRGGVTYYYHLNTHGDVVALSDPSGNLVAQYTYDAWGNIVSQSGSLASANPYRYTGYRYDEATGLYYLMARYYDPSTGRFLTADTVQGEPSVPLTLNGYLYGRNNPLLYKDPTGHWSWKDPIKKAANYAITVICNELRTNTLTDILFLIGGAGVGAFRAYRLATAGFTMLERHILRRSVIGAIKGAIGATLLGEGLGVVHKIQSVTSKLWNYEAWFDRNPIGRRIDNAITRVGIWLHNLVNRW